MTSWKELLVAFFLLLTIRIWLKSNHAKQPNAYSSNLIHKQLKFKTKSNDSTFKAKSEILLNILND